MQRHTLPLHSYSLVQSDLHGLLGKKLPRQKNYILLCIQGFAVFSFNQQKTAVSRGDLLIISPDLITVIMRTSRSFRVYALEISNTVANQVALLTDPNLLYSLYYNPKISLSPELQLRLYRWFEQTEWILSHVAENRSNVVLKNEIQHLLLVLEKLYPYEKLTESRSLQPQNRIFNKFCHLICEYCRTEHQVRFYANSLCITPYYLSKITSRLARMSPKRMIDEQLIAEIKQQLQDTELTVSEIAHLYCFDTPSYFCKFFRKYCNLSPMEYRQYLHTHP